jgi:glycosyltransferase involved in cell wall biosynthesis
MRKPILTIFYQYNPWHSSIGGIQTIISSFIKYAPDEFEVRLVGVGDRSTQKIGVWQESEFQGRVLQFFPLFALENDDVRQLIPTTVKYTAALMGRSFASDFMHFHRIEPTLNTRSWRGDKTLFIHNDIHTQFLAKGSKHAILWRQFPKAYFALERATIGQFERVLSCNTAATALYRELYPSLAQKISYYRNSVDTNIFYPASVAEATAARQAFAKSLGLSDRTRFLLFAGRLHPQKDPLLLVRSLAALAEPDIHLAIAGEGELTAAIQAEVEKLGLLKQVTMLGAVKQDKLADLHRLSSVCVLTSAYEGLPLVVLEALACGTPIVTTRAGDTPNLLTEQSGIVCDDRTPAAVAHALRKVLHNPNYFTPQACTQAAEPYSAKLVIHHIYEEMLQRWQGRSQS